MIWESPKFTSPAALDLFRVAAEKRRTVQIYFFSKRLIVKEERNFNRKISFFEGAKKLQH